MAKGSILSFNSLTDYCNYWDKLVDEAINKNTEYGKELIRQKDRIIRNLSQGETKDNLKRYGFPVPTSFNEAMDRRTFLNLPLYYSAYEELKPILSKLEKISEGILPKEIIQPTDFDTGLFSLDRAFMDIEKIAGLYSKKHKRFFAISEGEPLYDKKGKQKQDKEGNLIFILNSDKSEAVLTQLEEDGIKQFGTNNKKSYLIKTKVNRPNRTVRLFVLIGANAGLQTYWAGLTAAVLTNFLESKGYGIKITCVVGVSDVFLRMGGKNSQPKVGNRFSMINLKNYDEVTDNLKILYVMSDSSFFRVRQFQYFLAQQYKYNDVLNDGLGNMPSIDVFEEILYKEVKKRNIAEEKNTLYYFIGGIECTSIIGAQENLERIVRDAELKNRQALEELGYTY